MYGFMVEVNRKYGTEFKEYSELYEWSIRNLAQFWAEMWRAADIISSKGYDTVIDDPTRMPGAKWFHGAELNFAQNLLRYRDDRTAIIFRGEAMEAAVRKIIHNEPVLNRDALANPEALDLYQDLPELAEG
jgi:acetoacetyl-CoA synthetase